MGILEVGPQTLPGHQAAASGPHAADGPSSLPRTPEEGGLHIPCHAGASTERCPREHLSMARECAPWGAVGMGGVREA